MTSSSSPTDRRHAGAPTPDHRRRRRLVTLLVIAAAIALAIYYLTCGKGGRGLGGQGAGPGSGPGSARVVDAAPARCLVRVTADGLRLANQPITIEAAVEACRPSAGAEVIVTGDARQGDWDALRGALEAAGIPIFTKQR